MEDKTRVSRKPLMDPSGVVSQPASFCNGQSGCAIPSKCEAYKSPREQIDLNSKVCLANSSSKFKFGNGNHPLINLLGIMKKHLEDPEAGLWANTRGKDCAEGSGRGLRSDDLKVSKNERLFKNK